MTSKDLIDTKSNKKSIKKSIKKMILKAHQNFDDDITSIVGKIKMG